MIKENTTCIFPITRNGNAVFSLQHDCQISVGCNSAGITGAFLCNAYPFNVRIPLVASKYAEQPSTPNVPPAEAVPFTKYGRSALSVASPTITDVAVSPAASATIPMLGTIPISRQHISMRASILCCPARKNVFKLRILCFPPGRNGWFVFLPVLFASVRLPVICAFN